MHEQPQPRGRLPAQNRAASRRELLALAGGAALTGCAAASAAGPAEPPPPERRGQLDELFAHLTDQRDGLEAIRPEERAGRRARLGGLLAERGLDAYLCEGGPTMTYLAGVGWGRSERLFALVVLADGSHLWVCPAFEAEKARLRLDPARAPGAPGGEVVAWHEDEKAWRPLAAFLRERRVERVALDPQTRLFVATGMAGELGQQRVVDGQAVLVALRGVKDEHEIALLRRANELTQQAIEAVSHEVRPGMTGRDVAAMMSHAQRRLGLQRPWCLALVGPAAAYPHGDQLGRAIESGDLLLVDTGGSLLEYQSDNSRTWCVGGAIGSDELRAWNAVRDAQRRAFDAIRPGVLAREVDRAARAAIADAGYPGGFEVFTHRLGHGIGLEGHEAPYLDGGSDVRLLPGMTFSDEPGVYLYGRFGVRIEDIVLVTEDGADHFGSWQQQPLSPA